MPHHINAKRERVVEAVRRGIEGEAALEFIRQSGYAMSISGIAKHLRSMGGRGAVQELINNSKSNIEILEQCFPNEDLKELQQDKPNQGELFSHEIFEVAEADDLPNMPVFETTRMSIRIPTDLYTAIRLAARAEKKSQNQLIVDILTTTLSKKIHDMADLEKD